MQQSLKQLKNRKDIEIKASQQIRMRKFVATWQRTMQNSSSVNSSLTLHTEPIMPSHLELVDHLGSLAGNRRIRNIITQISRH